MNEYLIIGIMATLLLIMAIVFVKNKLNVMGLFIPTAHDFMQSIKRLMINNFGEEKGTQFFEMAVEHVKLNGDEFIDDLVDFIYDQIPEDKKIGKDILHILIDMIVETMLEYRAETGEDLE